MDSSQLARRLRRLAPLAVAAAIGAGVGVGAYALSDNGASQPAASSVVVPAQPASSTSSSSVDSLTQLYAHDAPGVVDITVTSKAQSGGTSTLPFPFGSPSPNQQPQQKKEEAEGAGFEIDAKGDILTAEHVVANATSIKVELENGSTASAKLVGSDQSTDTAVIRVDVPASQLHPLALGDSASVQPGQAVVAIGSPFGLPETMTEGIVSATNRTITAPNRFSISGAIQTDAAINHGNSGGPLIDVASNTVIGINDQIESDTQDNAGIGFATPIDAAKQVASTLIAGGSVKHPYLGVGIVDDSSGGAKVTQVVSGTPAAKAGLQKGDVITSFGGTRITNADTLTAAVGSAKPGETVHLTVLRGGRTVHVTLTLGVQPASAF